MHLLTSTLRSKIDSLWDKHWSGGIANPLTAIEQISYLLDMRRLDAADRNTLDDATWLGKEAASLFKDHDDCRWRHFRHLPGREMLDHVRDVVFP